MTLKQIVQKVPGRKNAAQHKSLASKWLYMGFGMAGTWLTTYMYVNAYGQWPIGKMYEFIVDSYGVMATPFIGGILLSFITSYIIPKRRKNDRS